MLKISLLKSSWPEISRMNPTTDFGRQTWAGATVSSPAYGTASYGGSPHQALIGLVLVLVFSLYILLFEPLCWTRFMALCQRRSRGEKVFFVTVCIFSMSHKKFLNTHKTIFFSDLHQIKFHKHWRQWTSFLQVSFTCPSQVIYNCAILIEYRKKTQYSFSILIRSKRAKRHNILSQFWSDLKEEKDTIFFLKAHSLRATGRRPINECTRQNQSFKGQGSQNHQFPQTVLLSSLSSK